MRISYWSSDVCSSDLCFAIAAAAGCLDEKDVAGLHLGLVAALQALAPAVGADHRVAAALARLTAGKAIGVGRAVQRQDGRGHRLQEAHAPDDAVAAAVLASAARIGADAERRSEEHTSELQSLMRISYAVFCL